MNFARLFIRFSLILSLLAQVTVSAKVAIRKPSSISSNDEIQDFLLLCWDHGAYRSGLQALEQNKLNLPQPVFHWWRGTFFMATENYYLAEKEFACLDSMIAAVDPKTPFRFISLTGITEAISMQMDRSNADLYAKQAILLLSNQVEVNIGEKWPRFQMGMAFFNLAHNARNNFTKADHEEFLKRYQEAGKLIALGRKILQPLLLKYPGLEAWVEIQEGNYNTDLTFYWSEAKSQSGGFGVNSHKAEAVLHYQSARKILENLYSYRHPLIALTYLNEYQALAYAREGKSRKYMLSQALQAALDTIAWKGVRIPVNLSPLTLGSVAAFFNTEQIFRDSTNGLLNRLIDLEPVLKVAEESHYELLTDAVLQNPNYLLETYSLRPWFNLAFAYILHFQETRDSIYFIKAWNLFFTYQNLIGENPFDHGIPNPVNTPHSFQPDVLNATKRNLVEKIWLRKPQIRFDDSTAILDSLVSIHEQITNSGSAENHLEANLKKIRSGMKQGDLLLGIFPQNDIILIQIISQDTYALFTHPFRQEIFYNCTEYSKDSIMNPRNTFPGNCILAMKAKLDSLIMPFTGKMKRLLFNCGPGIQEIAIENVVSGAFFGNVKNHPCIPTVIAPNFNKLNTRDKRAVPVLFVAPNYKNTKSQVLSGKETFTSLNSVLDIEISETKNVEETMNSFRDGKLVIFFGHSSMNPYKPQHSSLTFEKDNIEAGDFLGIKIKSPLVILAGCQTGAGNTTVMEGTHSIARQLILSGAGCVVATSWEVDDRATSEILVSFVKKLSEGEYISSALANAKIDFRIKYSGSEWEHPYYWAGIQQFGGDGIIRLEEKK